MQQKSSRSVSHVQRSETRQVYELVTKLQPPRLLATLVERPRLLRQLDSALEQKLTLVVAPAGFGKTTLVNQWRHERQEDGTIRNLAWLTLESSDSDVLYFWRLVIAACQGWASKPGRTALAILSEALQPPFEVPPLEKVLTPFLNDLAQQSSGGWLVLDDYHTLDNARIHRTLAWFIDHLPANLHILLLARAEPTLPLVHWRLKGELAELQSVDLRFSSEETAIFVEQTFSLPLPESARQRLEASLQGWPAGLRLLSLAKLRQVTEGDVEQILPPLGQQTGLGASYQPLIDYFITEILNTQTGQLQDFLLQTSALSRLHSSLCAAVTGREESAELLKTMERGGLFLETDETGEWYRFHALFAQALRQEAERRLSVETRQTLAKRASAWYEQHSLREEAIEMALLGGEFERAAGLIEQQGVEEETVEMHTARRWLSALPAAVLHAHPQLCWLAAQTVQEDADLAAGEKQRRVEELLQLAEEGWSRQNNEQRHSLIALSHAIINWQARRMPQAIADARRVLELLPEDEQDHRLQMWRGICQFIVGTGALAGEQFDAARSLFLQAYACSLVQRNRHFTRGLLILIGTCYNLMGDLHQAREYYQQALAEARRHDDREVIVPALLGQASVAFARNELTKAEQQANEALKFAAPGDTDLRHAVAFQLAQLAYARGQITQAQQQVSRLLARLQITMTNEAATKRLDVQVLAARLALATGDVQTARQIVALPELKEHTIAKMLQARLLLGEGQPEAAVQQLEQLRLVLQEARAIIEVKLLLTLAHAACQRPQQARQWLWQAISQARPGGFITLFLNEGEALAHLLHQLGPTPREPALYSYTQTVLRAFTPTDEAYTPLDVLPEPLSAQEQRVLSLLAAGHTNQEIARELIISINTAKDHIKHIYRKLDVNNRLQASEAARRLKLLY